jgi:protein TonB
MEVRAISMRVEPPSLSRQSPSVARPLQGERRARLRRFAGRNWLPIALVSLGLHLLFGVAILRGPAWLSGKKLNEQPIYAQVELVDLKSPTVGDGPHPKGEASPPSPPAAPPPAPDATVTPDPPAISPPAEVAALSPAGEAVVPPPGQPAQTATAPAPAPQRDLPAGRSAEPPATRLDDSSDFGRGLVENVIPAGPDSTVHNDPPVYPRLSARYREQGTVMIMVLVAQDGSARDVQVTQSSGYDRLDQAAKEAVAKWHFRPGQQNGIAVESYYPVNVQFELGNK